MFKNMLHSDIYQQRSQLSEWSSDRIFNNMTRRVEKLLEARGCNLHFLAFISHFCNEYRI
jgi:hypothetical protein